MNSYQKALKASVEYFDGDELAAKVFVDKYALKDQDNELLEFTPRDMHERVAKEVHRIEVKKFGDKALSYEEIFGLFDRFKYIIPQGSCLYGIGNPNFVTLSNCYVIDPPVDSYAGILWTDEQLVQISKRRGGVGTDLSKLRPAGTPTLNAACTSTGVVSFAERYSHSIREVGQGGRRGALMLTLSVHHPEVLAFAKCKQDKTKVTGANISIRLSNEFMEAVINDTQYEQRWPVDSNIPEIAQRVSAREVWDTIVENAHANAEPGILFWDNIINESPADCYRDFQTVSTNPCSEIPLSTLDSCRLLLLNTFGFVDKPFTKDASFDWNKFYEGAQLAQRIMDDILDIELEYIQRIIKKIKKDSESPEIKARELKMWERIYDNCMNGRRTGTGVTAIGDTIASLNMSYGSEEAISFIDRLYKTHKFGCYKSSIDLAKSIGSFKKFDARLEQHNNPFFKRFEKEVCDLENGEVISGRKLMEEMRKHGRRNIACLTTAPAGSISLQTQTTSGIEPLYAMTSIRRKKGNPGDKEFRSDFVDANGDHWMEFEVQHPKLRMWSQITGEEDITKSPWYNNCAEDLDYKFRVRLQATAQKHIDHAISSTVNLPSDVTVEQIQEIYEMAWQLGCKGITVYRKGCRDGVILEKPVDKQKNPDTIVGRPRVLPCDVHHTKVQEHSYFVIVGLLDGKPYEVFAGKNGFISPKIKSGTITRKRKNFYIVRFDGTDDELSPVTASTTEMEEAITRLTSLALRSGANMHRVVQQLEKVGERRALHCFARGVSRVLKKYIPNGTEEENEKCPDCGSQSIVRQEGCITCKGCGWSRCL